MTEYLNRLEEIWKSQWITNNGEQHKNLEKKLRQYLKVDNLSLINNGTTALQIALNALDIEGEVITTPFTFAATVHAISWNGLKPVFCDIDPETLTIDVRKIEQLINKDTSALLPVHVFGNPCNVKKIQKIAEDYDLKIIYDAAHAFGTEIFGKSIGKYGNITMYSFHATKLFNTIEGGALACSDEKLKGKIDLIRNFGLKNEENVALKGINGKMNEFQAAMGLEVLKLVEMERKKRKKIKETYIQNLKNVDGISISTTNKNVKDSYQYFVIRIDENKFGVSRNHVYDNLRKYNVYPRKYFYPLCSNYDCYRDIPSAGKERLSIANKVANEVLALPFYGELGLKNATKICEIIMMQSQ